MIKECGIGSRRNMTEALKQGNNVIVRGRDTCADDQSQRRQYDEICVIGFTSQTGQTILLAVSNPAEVKLTPGARNSLML